ncbi:MAG: UxaA family hydrolase [Ardenticatenaceae bacterium]|nr:UxaA family hydrolase [Ardenticatenaceae bacterium]
MFALEDVGRLPAPHDNCAIAVRMLAAGTAVAHAGQTFALSHTLLEGHRFAVTPIAAGAHLLSWGMPFGTALRDIAPGEVLCNEGVLHELRSRRLDFALPGQANFSDEIPPFVGTTVETQHVASLQRYADERTFLGFRRGGQRGVGTRNMIVVLGVSALVAGFVRRVAAGCQGWAADWANVEGITAVAHTEGNRADSHNHELLLRTLAGFVVHSNVGAVLVVDAAPTGVTNVMLQAYMQAHDYPLADVPHAFFSLSGSFTADLAQAQSIIADWLPVVNAMPRTPEPLSELKIALQCGGSDAFSGVSGNPLAAWVAKEIIAYGGAANLAETDELVGAEAYVLQKVREAAVAEQFLAVVNRFKTWAGWHGHSAEGNPSGGNKYRGLYNIYLKSLGAAAKRHPDVPLDGVLEYGERMAATGFYFMDSPGNDLESIAGQVAAGCNLIFFVTGNGSITNFPFVPTLKIVTTNARYEQLRQEMDVNAGAYLDGTPLPVLGAAMLDLTVAVAAGQRTVGEKAGHAQVQLWRDWALAAPGAVVAERVQVLERPLAITPFAETPPAMAVPPRRVGLVLPTSLCSGQIARLAVQRLKQLPSQLDDFVTLVHTEGCGSSTQAEYIQTMLGYATHPLVADCLLLEHGCEKTHNDFWRQAMQEAGVDPGRFGWASVQGDGGIEKSVERVVAWFAERGEEGEGGERGEGRLALGVVTEAGYGEETAVALAQLIHGVAAAGGTVVLPDFDPLWQTAAFRAILQEAAVPTLAYAQAAVPGLHMMATPSRQPTETLTGLGAAGVSVVLAWVQSRPQQGHPLLPVLNVGVGTAVPQAIVAELDGDLEVGEVAQWPQQMLALALAAASGRYTPRVNQQQNVDFQITRGLLGISL